MINQLTSGQIFRGVQLLLLILVTVLLTANITTAETSRHGKMGTAGHVPAPVEITADMTCAVCGMYPAKYPKWHTQVILKDGQVAAFDGCKCMFNYLLGNDGHKSHDVAAVWVKDFNTGKWINGKEANFVIGSGMMGSMGKELIPFGDHMAAMDFHKEHGGHMGHYADISLDTLKPLSMGKMHHGGGPNKQGQGHDAHGTGHDAPMQMEGHGENK